MSSAIQRIFLRSCRGATTETELVIAPAKSLVVIFGENGTGKSTLVDAIDIVCNGRCGSLDERSSASTRQHLAAVGHDARDVCVKLTAGGETWTAGLTTRGLTVVGPEPRPQAYVLRRSQLLRLVEAQPSQRYEALKPFIDVEGVTKSEQALANAVRAAQTRLRDENQRKADADDALQHLWEAEGRPGAAGDTAADWAAGWATADTPAIHAMVPQFREVIAALDAAVSAREPAVAAHAVRREKAAAVTAIEAEIAAAGDPGAGEGIALLALLQEAQRFLAAPDASSDCPVCRQPADAAALRRQIDERLGRLSHLTALRGRHEAAVRERDSANLYAEQCRERFVTACRALARVALSAGVETATGASMDWGTYALLLSADEDVGLEAARQANALLAALSGVREQLSQIVETAQADVGRFQAVRQFHERTAAGEARVQEAEALLERLQAALEIVRAERIGFVQQVLDDVAAECNRLYTRIHPGESLELARLRLDENRKGSLHQEARFEEALDVPPQAYFSESHLDTLAFCFFLAIARHAGRGAAILVLDDIFTSADAAHLTRLADLLADECAEFSQILVTTHLREWPDHYRAAYGPDAHVQIVELEPWTAEEGIRIASPAS